MSDGARHGPDAPIESITLNGKAYGVIAFDLDGVPGVSGMLDGEDADGARWEMPFWIPADAVAGLEDAEVPR